MDIFFRFSFFPLSHRTLEAIHGSPCDFPPLLHQDQCWCLPFQSPVNLSTNRQKVTRIFLNLRQNPRQSQTQSQLQCQGQARKTVDSLPLEVVDRAFHQANLMESEWFSSFKLLEGASGYSQSHRMIRAEKDLTLHPAPNPLTLEENLPLESSLEPHPAWS